MNNYKIETVPNSGPLTLLSAWTFGPYAGSLPIRCPSPLVTISQPTRTLTNSASIQQRRWSVACLHSHLQRTKWTLKTPSLQTGDIVQEPDTPHLQWSKINSMIPSADYVVWVVEVKTPKRLLWRFNYLNGQANKPQNMLFFIIF